MAKEKKDDNEGVCSGGGVRGVRGVLDCDPDDERAVEDLNNSN